VAGLHAEAPQAAPGSAQRDEIRRLEDSRAAQTEHDQLVLTTLANTGLRLSEFAWPPDPGHGV